MKLSSLAVAVSLVVATGGCGHKEDTTTITTPQGDVTIKRDAGGSGGTTTSLSSPEGQTTVTSKVGNMTEITTDKNGKSASLSIGNKVDPAEFGIKPYPGATEKEGSSIVTDTPDGKSMVIQLDTTDDAAKALDFYKGEIKADTTTSTPEGGLIAGTTSAGDKAVIVVAKSDKGSSISLTVTKKKKP